MKNKNHVNIFTKKIKRTGCGSQILISASVYLQLSSLPKFALSKLVVHKTIHCESAKICKKEKVSRNIDKLSNYFWSITKRMYTYTRVSVAVPRQSRGRESKINTAPSQSFHTPQHINRIRFVVNFKSICMYLSNILNVTFSMR